MRRSPRRHRRRSAVRLVGTGLLLVFCGCPKSCDTPPEPEDNATVRRAMEEVIDHVDSPAYTGDVSWEEHVVLCYRLAQNRDPTPVELALLEGVREDPGISRSDVLALALGEEQERDAWAGGRRFLERYDLASFRADAAVTAAARQLTRTEDSDAAVARALALTAEEARLAAEHVPAERLLPTRSEPGIAYQTYFGFLHAHSHLSDGEGTAEEAYTFARDQGGLDFFGLTDHGINLFVRWPWNNKWRKLKTAAEAAHNSGTYVTLSGFEWSNPFLGHVSVLNSDDFTHILSRPRMFGFYRWLAKRPGAVARFNHPGRAGLTVLGTELVREFHHLDIFPDAIAQMVGIELWNRDRGFDEYFYAGSWNENPTSFLDFGIQKGWRLGALGGQDNHHREWGTMSDFRTAALATELTREAILDAYANRRIYATEDKDLVLDVRASGHPMGSILAGIEPRFEVTARDGSGDTFETVRLFRDGEEIASAPVNGNEVAATLTDPSPTGGHYYYVIVTQADDGDANGRNDEAISSPIWIRDDSGAEPPAEPNPP